MAAGFQTQARRARAADDDRDEPDGEVLVDLSDDADEGDDRPSRGTSSRRSRRREPGEQDDAEADLVADIADATAERVASALKADRRKLDKVLAEHGQRLADLEEGQEILVAELAELESKAEAKAAKATPAAPANGTGPASANGTTPTPQAASANGATPAAAPKEIAIVEPDLGRDKGGKEDHLPDDPNGPKQPRSGWRNLW
ncbi:MAG: hypothetical protein ACYDD0_08500 [Candidatus Dormibacteria bacterium]